VSIPQLLVHDKGDNVGVVVVEGVKAGDELLCVVTEDDSDFKIVTNHDIPIGHKIALKALAEGDTVIKYGEDIGRMVAAASKGDHVHTHNLKTKRW
jgi:(2R)-sulfolactate sulfo-lyase subunit alpha